jgi:hypothetical protein
MVDVGSEVHMTTPDGISGEEWNRVTELAFEVWKHINDRDKEKRRVELFNYLDALEMKYGPLPSILATRADMSSPDEIGNKEKLLLRAYAMAIERQDRANALYIAHSLADMYLGGLGKPLEGRRWLACFGTHLYDDSEDAWWQDEYERLKTIANALGTTVE